MSTPARSVHFAALVAKQPENPLFRFSLAQSLLNEKREADAVEHLVQCAGGRADWMMPRILLGKALLHLGRTAEAKPWLEAALTLAIEQDHQDPEGELRALLAGL
jgi:predicted Zn-dependent protease